MKRLFLFTAAAMAAASLAQAAAPSAGVAEARRWVALVDEGAYERSWTEAGANFKANASQADWVAAAAPVRRPLGAAVTRELVSEIDADTLSGTEGRDFKVVAFYTKFAGRPEEAGETVVLQRESGAWKVVEYDIK